MKAKTLFTLTISEEDGSLCTYAFGDIHQTELIAQMEIYLLRLKMSVLNHPLSSYATGEIAKEMIHENILTPDHNKK